MASDPEFAAQEVKSWQRKFSQKNSAYEKVAPLDPVLDRLGIDAKTAGDLLQRLNDMVAQPSGRNLWQRFVQTGRVPGADDAYDEDDEPDPRDVEMQSLRNQVLETRSEVAKTKLQGHFQKTFQTYPFSDEQRQRIMDGVERQIEAWGKSDQGVQALANLNERSARNLILNQLDDEEIQELGYQARLRREQQRQGRSTDAPPGVGTTGREKSAKPDGASPRDLGLAAFREAARAEGWDPDRPLPPMR